MTVGATTVERESGVVERVSPLVRNAWALAISQGSAAMLGFGFWVLVARAYSAAEVGVAGTLIVVMTTTSTVAQLNYTMALPRLLPGAARPLDLLRSVYLQTAAASVALATIVAIVLSRFSEELGPVISRPGVGVAFVLGAVAWTWFTIQDASLAGFGRAPFVAGENVLFGMIKVGLGLAFAAFSTGIFLSWVVSTALVVSVVTVVVAREAARRQVPTGAPVHDLGAGPRRFRFFDFGGISVFVATMAVLPLLVLRELGAEAAGIFSISISIAWSLESMVVGVGTSFVVEAAREEDQRRAHLIHVVRVFLPLIVLGVGVVMLAAPLILLPFGPEYGAASNTLRILVLAVPIRFCAQLLMGLFRLRFAGPALLVSQAVPFVAGIPAALLMIDRWGTAGAATGWLVGQAASLAVAVAIMARRARRSSSETPRDDQKSHGEMATAGDGVHQPAVHGVQR